ncbi:MAG TPA: DinB family protein [Vicinamibacterales bacterium]
MLPAAQTLVEELEAEAQATRRVLERLPADRFDWQPHPKSLTAGQLAQHIASIPGNVARFLSHDGMDLATRQVEYPSAESTTALLATLDASLQAARDLLSGLDAGRAQATWRLTFGDREVLARPRLAVFRTMALNHWYHHRGEMVVYLRLMGIPVPVVYGRSADENPFAPRPA